MEPDLQQPEGDKALSVVSGLSLIHISDASADQSVHAVLHQEACQCAVTAAVGVNTFRMRDFAVRSFINLELFSVAEMLKNLTVFITPREASRDTGTITTAMAASIGLVVNLSLIHI